MSEQVLNSEKMLNLIDDCCGVDEKGKSNSVVSLVYEKWNIPEKKVQPIRQHSCVDTIVEMHIINGKYMQLDLIFINSKAPALKLFWNTLNMYAKDDNDKELSVKRITVFPKFYKNYYMDLAMPIFCSLQPTKVNEDIRSIRLLFDLDDVSFYYSDEINMESLVQDILNQQYIDENTAPVS